MKEKISVCMNCAGKNINFIPQVAFSPKYIGGEVECNDCGFVGLPIEFDDISEYNKFLDEFKKEKES